MPSDFDSNAWKVQHNALVQKAAEQLRSDNYNVTYEGQNSFKIRGSNNTTVAGKPDLIGVRNKDLIIVDAKTGQPKPSDAVQVMIYMWAIPFAKPQFKGFNIRGRVDYDDHSEKIRQNEIDDEFIQNLTALIRRIGGPEPLRRVPSHGECQFCSITENDCDERMWHPEPTVDVDAF